MGFLSPLFGGQSKALMWAQRADKKATEGCVFAHYWEQFRKHMAKLTTDENLFISPNVTGNRAGTYRNLLVVPTDLGEIAMHGAFKIMKTLTPMCPCTSHIANSQCKQFANLRPEVNQEQEEFSINP